MNKILKIMGIAIIPIVFTNCSSPTVVYNVKKHPIDIQKTNEDVYKAIKDAGASLGWVIRKKQNGVATGKLLLREHMALVKITYDAKSYNIEYVDSKNINYNKEDNTIHKNYNGWIRNLERAIEARL